MLSFFHNYFLLMTLHFCIKSTINIVVVVVVVEYLLTLFSVILSLVQNKLEGH